MATLINTYADNAVSELISEVLSQDLSELNLDEILNLLWDLIANIGGDIEISNDIAKEAADSIKQVIENPVEAIALILGLADLMDARVKQPLSDYVSNPWVDAAMEAFGDRLENLDINDHSWILYCLLEKCTDRSEVDEEKTSYINEGLQENINFTIAEFELIPAARAIAHIAVERYYSQVNAA